MERSKAETYARLFRKAGTLFGKGNIAQALEALKEGEALATSNGDQRMARQFAAEIERLNPSGQS